MEYTNPSDALKYVQDKSSKKHVYKKRSGTYGVTGQLYETKLLSLILFRAMNDDDINNFYLGTNLDNIGAFDDICLKFESFNKTAAVFIQAKHRDDPHSKGGITDADLRNQKSDFCLTKYFHSYLKIKQKFENESSGDKMFTGGFEGTEFNFIIYTSASSHKMSKRISVNFLPTEKKSITKKIRDLISTNTVEDIFKVNYEKKDFDYLLNILKEEQLDFIVRAILECISTKAEKPSNKSIEVLSRYGQFLIPNMLIYYEEHNNEDSKAIINPQFFYSNDLMVIKLRERLFTNLLCESAYYDEDEASRNLLGLCYGDNVTYYLKKLIGNILVLDKQSNKLKIRETASEKLQQYKNDINDIGISQSTLKETLYEVGQEKLKSLIFKLPQNLRALLNIASQTKTNLFDEEVKIVKHFFDSLYFYTSEGKQDKVENILKTELNKYGARITPIINIQPEALFLKLHDKIQKWSMLQQSAYYLTKLCDFIEISQTEILHSPHLTIFNYYFVNEYITPYDIAFQNEIIAHKLGLDDLPYRLTNIVTKVKTLSCIKLKHFFPEGKCLFLCLKLIKNLASNEIKQLLEEMKTVLVEVLVIVFDNSKDGYEYDFLNNIVAHFSKKIIALTNNKLSIEKLKGNYNVVIDNDNGFAKLNQESQRHILAYDKVTIQGENVCLEKIFGNGKCDDLLITEEIVYKILNNEILDIGKPLADQKYASMRNYYIPRYLYAKNADASVKLIDLVEIKRPVVVVTAEPGMGKSTLLTHISVETKRKIPNVWIVRINLLDHCSQFFKWQKEQKTIDLIDTMTQICKTELGIVSDDIQLEIMEDVLVIKSCSIHGLALLHLKLIIHSYNTRNIIFLFDGFDEICPHYKKECVKFMNNVITKGQHLNNTMYDDDFSLEQFNNWKEYEEFHEEDILKKMLFSQTGENCYTRVWIASRPYNQIKEILEYEYGKTFQLKSLSSRDQKIYYHKYFLDNIKLHELSENQFDNVLGFFEFMSQFRRSYGQEYKIIHITSIPLNHVYEAAVDHFRNDILYAPINVDKERLRAEWVSSKELPSLLETCTGSLYEISKASKLAGIPLHMYIAAFYFVDEIMDTSEKDKDKKWDLNTNTFAYYTKFLETKFKSIRLEEKIHRNINLPEERMAYEKEKREFVEGHTMLAFYAMFHNNTYYLCKVISKKEIKKVKKLMKSIKNGEEKTGLIHRIHNNVPIFVHLAFAEYFAIEYLANKFKKVKKNWKDDILDFILNYLLLHDEEGLMCVFNHKLMYDEEFKNILSTSDYKQKTFNLLLAQNDMKEWKVWNYDDVYEEKIESALNKTVSTGLTEVSMFLLNSLEGNLNVDNFATFFELITDKFFIRAASVNAEKEIMFLLDTFRSLDSKIVRDVVNKSNLRKFLSSSGSTLKTNEEILKLLSDHIKHLTTAYWYFDNEDQQFHQFYFNDSF